VRILVVDDEPDFLQTFERLLAVMGHVAVTEMTPVAAIARIDRGGLDLVITDLRMPPPGGQAVVWHARRARPALPVIIITGQPSPFTAELARQASATLLLKPVGHQELRAAIDRLGAGPARPDGDSATPGR
jgi:DNA-binding NtrC family response regulator